MPPSPLFVVLLVLMTQLSFFCLFLRWQQTASRVAVTFLELCHEPTDPQFRAGNP